MTPKLSKLAATLLVTGLCASATGLFAAVGDRTGAPPWTVLEVRPAQGEQCLVCRQAIHDGEIVELRYKGRRFHVAESMLADFEGDPALYFETLEAHSALFDEGATDGPRVTTAWLFVGMYVLFGLVAAALCGYLALSRGKPALPWFVAGLLANVVAVVVLLLTPRGDLSSLPAGVPDGLAKIPTTREPVGCVACGALNHPSAARCSACGAELSPTIASETAAVLTREPST